MLTKHSTGVGQMWPKYLPLTTVAYNTFNSPNTSNFSPSASVFGSTPKMLLDLETNPYTEVSGTVRDFFHFLNKM